MVDINQGFTAIAPAPASEMDELESIGATNPYYRRFEVVPYRGTGRRAPQPDADPSIQSRNKTKRPFRSRSVSSGDPSNPSLTYAEHDAPMASGPQVDFFFNRYVTPPLRQDLDAVAVRILRKHFLGEIVRNLEHLEQQAQQAQSADYANKLFRTMRTVRDRLMTDPFSAIVLALHDALAFENNWTRYTAQQYSKAREILVRFGNQDIHEDKALKAIAALEDVGFDTTPFTTSDEDLATA
jgi:hypothetical protein